MNISFRTVASLGNRAAQIIGDICESMAAIDPHAGGLRGSGLGADYFAGESLRTETGDDRLRKIADLAGRTP